MTGLTDFQADVARLFFPVPASDGFLLAGGGALLASGLTSRPTEDLDFFGDREHVDIAAARDQFETAVAGRGWQSTRVQDSGSFVRLRVTDGEVIVGPQGAGAAATSRSTLRPDAHPSSRSSAPRSTQRSSPGAS